MSTKRSILISGGLTFVMTVALIVAISMSGFTPQISTTTIPSTTSTSTTSSSATSTSTSTVTSTTSITYTTTPYTTTTTTTITTQPTTTTSEPREEGTLSILLTDPPILPEGITEVHITYDSMAVHAAESNETHGWIEVGGGGTLNLMTLVDISQTISSVNMKTGKYNLIRFNITAAKIVYNNREYPAVVRTGNLTVPIIGGIEVKDYIPSATIIDVHPTVFNIGSKSEPDFVISAVARAYPVPESEEQPKMHQVGFRMNLGDKEWWRRLREQFASEIEVTSCSLSRTSLAATVKNTGNVSLKLKLVIISQLTTVPRTGNKTNWTPIFSEAAVFWVDEDGGLEPVMLVHNRTQTEKEAQIIFSGRGYNLTVSQQVKLTYRSEIVFGFGLPMGGTPFKPTYVMPGAEYLVTVIGDGALARTVVVAS